MGHKRSKWSSISSPLLVRNRAIRCIALVDAPGHARTYQLLFFALRVGSL
jgi:hypothetical protein